MLAIINEDYPKFRLIQDLTENDFLINYFITLLNIKCSSLEEKKDLQIQMIVILDFIKSKFGFLTIPEIKEAFKMYVAKDFGHKEIYRNLDTILVSDVLNCFVNFRSDSLRTYNEKNNILAIEASNKLSDSEKEKIMIDAVNNKFTEFIETKQVSEPVEHIFKELFDRKLLKMPTKDTPNTSAYYDKKLSEAKIQVERELKSQISTSKKETNKIKEELVKILNNESGKVEIRAKKLVLIDFFNKQIELKKEKIL